ncbi:arylsulfatase [Marinimicrobium alkaliphilum]|uniref:arylsulfatase n=1 Tax=Marinimicrobium alkaliphilum TaxID=2202654 RepID=UPI0018E09B18|nr:arylsulfatase [Marinimicrobium alkaliphilum]
MNVLIKGFCCFLALVVIGCSSEKPVADTAPEKMDRPNILLIVADDLGYTDIGAFGGEIPTPTLDSLAQSGVMLTDFYVAPTCSPTRAMLMSGTDNHRAGLGAMAEFMQAAAPELMGKPGYEGHLNDQVAPLPQLLKDAGYDTYMTGKWHLGLEKETSPAARGFDKSFALLHGGSGHFSDLGLGADTPKALYRENGELTELPDDFYSTQFYAERMIQYISDRENADKPFFGYLAYTAPHWPLQAPEESVARHEGRYSEGHKTILAERLKRQKALGLIPADTDIEQYMAMVPDWDSLSEQEQRVAERRMEIYAAMIEDIDRYTGKLVDRLKAMGEYENTLILFMSDNGAQAGGLPTFYQWAAQCCDNSHENMGKSDSYLFPEEEWARVSTGIFKGFKGQVTEGGIRAPAILHYPRAGISGGRYGQFLSAKDVLPTLLEFAGTEHPGTRYQGREVHPVQGKSFAPVVFGEQAAVHADDYNMGWELFGDKALRRGDWKLVFDSRGDRKWRLYNLAKDPGERDDLAQQEPERFKTLMAEWEEYVEDNGVILKYD